MKNGHDKKTFTLFSGIQNKQTGLSYPTFYLPRRHFARQWQDEHPAYSKQSFTSELLYRNELGRLSVQDLIELTYQANISSVESEL